MRSKSRFILLAALLLAACQGGGPDSASGLSEPSDLKHFVGSMHEHSGFSDGQVGATPADFYAAGKAQGLDFMASSEHSDNALLPVTANGDCASPEFLDCLTPSPDGLLKWQSTQAMADAASDESFTAIRGFEWTSDRFGHINVYFSEHDLNAKLDLGYAVSMEAFWFWFGAPVSPYGGSDGLMVFNHPGREDTLHAACESLGPLADACGTVYNGDPGYNWNDFEYRPELAERVVGIEMYGKSSHYYDGDNGAPPGGWYAHALSKGWHLGPIGAEDEHGLEWAQPSRAKTVILAESRSREDLKAGLLARRFYALAHAYNDLRLEFTALTQSGERLPLGSRLSLPAGEMLTLSAKVSGLEQARLEFVGAGGQALQQIDASQGQWSVSPIGDGENWVFLRVIDRGDQDRDETAGEVVAVSSPIWYRSVSSDSAP